MHLVLLIVLLKPIFCARILGIFPLPIYSHQSVFQPIWRELSLRGHQVTVITTNPIKDPSLTNLKEIDLNFTYKLVFEDHKMQEVVNTESNILVLMTHVFMVMQNMTAEQLKHPEVQELIRGDDRFDLIIVEAHVPAWFGFVKKYGCPLIAITSMPLTNFYKRVVGNLNNPVYTHSFNLPFDENMSLLQRIMCVLFEIFDEIQNSLLYAGQQKTIRQALGDPDINLYEIFKNVSLFFTNEIPGFSKVTTSIPSVVQLNGLQIKPAQVLPEELEDFLDGASRGAVYFSLGSNVKSYLIGKEKLDVLLGAFGDLPYRVVWKFEDQIDNLPSNVKLVSWAPQQDILRHRNTKLFITQGGLQSIDEAIRFKVPVLGFPFFGDQFYNVIRIKRLQIGTWVDFDSLTKESLKVAIAETVDNRTYLENLEEMSDLLNYALSSLDKAIWWIEYVIRHQGAPHLRSSLADIPFYQYYLFDVIAFLLIVFGIVFLVLLRLVTFAGKCRNSAKVKVHKS